MTKTQTQNEIQKLKGRKGGLETQKRKLEEKLEELRAKRERLEARIAELMAEPSHNPEKIAKLREKLFETATDIGLIEAAIRAAEDQIEAVTRELEAAKKKAEEAARVEAELRYIEIAEELDKRIPEVARLAADALEAIHDAYPKTGASWAAPEGLANSLLKSLGFALVRELRDRGQTGLAAVVQIQSGTFAAPPPKPLSQAFVSDLALRTWEKRRHDTSGDGDVDQD